jgi:hypothetical protein
MKSDEILNLILDFIVMIIAMVALYKGFTNALIADAILAILIIKPIKTDKNE